MDLPRASLNRAINLHYYNYAVYGEGSHKIIDKLKIIAGARIDVNSRFDATPISPRAALIYNGLGGRLALKYIFSMAYVAPAPYFGHNVFDNGVQLSHRNPNLKPERATSNEVNVTWKTNHLLLSGSGYFNYQSDLLITAQSEAAGDHSLSADLRQERRRHLRPAAWPATPSTSAAARRTGRTSRGVSTSAPCPPGRPTRSSISTGRWAM